MKTCIVLTAEPWMRIRAFCGEVAFRTEPPQDLAAPLSVFPVHLNHPVLSGHRHQKIASRREVIQRVTVQPFFRAGSREKNSRATICAGPMRTDIVFALRGTVKIHVVE